MGEDKGGVLIPSIRSISHNPSTATTSSQVCSMSVLIPSIRSISHNKQNSLNSLLVEAYVLIPSIRSISHNLEKNLLLIQPLLES